MDKTIVSKMRIKEGCKVIFINTDKQVENLIMLDKTISMAKKAPADVVFVTYQSLLELNKNIEKNISMLNPGGVVWIIYPKSDLKKKFDINRDSAWAELKKYQMTLVGNIAINDSWSSLRVKKV
jgi:hypothetical protein